MLSKKQSNSTITPTIYKPPIIPKKESIKTISFFNKAIKLISK